MLAKHNMLINFVLSQGHTANSVTSILGSQVTIVIWQHGLHFNISTRKIYSRTLNHLWQLICSWSLYQVNKLYSFPPTGVNSLSCSKRADHHAGALGSSDIYKHLTGTLLCSGNTMNAVYLTNQIHYEHIKLLLVTSKGIATSEMTNCNVFCTVTCALAMVASLEIKAPKQLPGSRVYALQRGCHPDADSNKDNIESH